MEQTIISSQSSQEENPLFLFICIKSVQVFCEVPVLNWRILIHQLSILCENNYEGWVKHGPNMSFWKSHFIHAEQRLFRD